MKTIKELFKGIDYRLINVKPNRIVKGISSDSRTMKNGELFIAVKGHEQDGHNYIPEALKKGAAVICSERPIPPSEEAGFIVVGNTAKILSVLATRFFDDPSRHLKLIGVTGTNGKTTTSYLVYEILKTAKKSPSLLGSVKYKIGGDTTDSSNTTPGPVTLHSLLSQMRYSGSDYVVMEVSSHALKQSRTSKIDFGTAVLTNITGDHLDYHKTMDDYVKAKRLLFESLKKKGIAVLNRDDKSFNEFKKSTKGSIISYGIKKKADFRATQIELDINGSRFFMDTPNGTINVRTPLIGRHNVYNILAAAATSFAQGIDFNVISEAISRFGQMPGRLESVDAGQRFKIFIDYAHTHDALNNVLSCLRGLCSGKLVVVFGCGGNRDRRKRPGMGKAAGSLADYVILTNDNPRREDPDTILDEIEKGFPRGFNTYKRIPERSKAIEESLKDRKASDIVVIAGKGHEEYQIIGEKTFPFNDKKVVKKILARANEALCSV